MEKDIPICFFKLFYPKKKPSKKGFLKIYKQGLYLIKRNWTVSNITNRMVAYDKQNKQPPISLFKIINKTKTPPLNKEGNILKDKFYYHNSLQKTSKPTKISINYDTGEIKRKTDPYFLEIKKYYSTKDLNNYFHDKMKINNQHLLKMNYGGFKKIINDYDLDLLLFTIDSSFKYCQDEQRPYLNSYSQLFSYMDKGLKLLKEIKNSSSGRIVPYYKAYLEKRGAKCE